MLVVACNTASSVALLELENCFQLPVIGVIEPGARRAVSVTRTGRIGVIGTEGTIKSGAYTLAIKQLAPDADVVGVPCPLFVPLVEEGWLDHPVTRLTAEEYLRPLRKHGIDTLVLGCTHYPLLKNVLQEVLGPEVVLIDSAEENCLCRGYPLARAELVAPGQSENDPAIFCYRCARAFSAGRRRIPRPSAY